MALSQAIAYTFVMDRLTELLPHLPVIAAFAETGLVTGAADILGIPQPQASRSLSRLESVTGLTLRQRDGRKVSPTAAALELGNTARIVLDQLQVTLANMTTEFRGKIAIAFQHSLGETLVPAVIKKFVTEQPLIDFELIQGSRADCLSAVESGRADAAFIAVVPDSLLLRTQHIYTEELMLAVPHGHRLAERKSITAGDFAGEGLIAMRHGLGLRSTTDSLFDRWGINPPVSFEGQEISTVLGLVAAGLGVAVVPCRNYAAPVALLPFKAKDAHRPIIMTTSRERDLSLAAKLFCDSVARFIAEPAD